MAQLHHADANRPSNGATKRGADHHAECRTLYIADVDAVGRSADLFLTTFRRMPTASVEGLGSNLRVASERSRQSAPLGTLRSARALGVRRRHAPRYKKKPLSRAHGAAERTAERHADHGAERAAD